MALGDSDGGADGGGSGGTQRDNPGVGGVFLRGRRVSCVALDREVTEGIQRPHQPI